jgi:hypothetical protein
MPVAVQEDVTPDRLELWIYFYAARSFCHSSPPWKITTRGR